ncbi:UNVERIFIED_CONTAM: hypothetical protein K2H54_062248 [Gekko kuhli]
MFLSPSSWWKIWDEKTLAWLWPPHELLEASQCPPESAFCTQIARCRSSTPVLIPWLKEEDLFLQSSTEDPQPAGRCLDASRERICLQENPYNQQEKCGYNQNAAAGQADLKKFQSKFLQRCIGQHL